jgi:ABC-type lipoprotein release transport system permease subunit
VAHRYSGVAHLRTAKQLLTLGAYTILMIVVCLSACVVPTRRALSVQPTEAPRDY